MWLVKVKMLPDMILFRFMLNWLILFDECHLETKEKKQSAAHPFQIKFG